jgi:RHS repeat-associated protein
MRLVPVRVTGYISPGILFLASCLFLGTPPSHSQVQGNDPVLEDGTKPYGSFSGGISESANMLNGKLNLHIPLISYPQRGGKLQMSFSIVYVNNLYKIHLQDPPNAPNGSCITGRPNTCQQLLNLSQGGIAIVPDAMPGPIGGGGSPYFVQLSDLTTHFLNPLSSGAASQVSVDGSGYSFRLDNNGGQCPEITSSIPIPFFHQILTDNRGNRYTYSCYDNFTSAEDANGNQIIGNSIPSGSSPALPSLTSWTDTMGRVIPIPPGQQTTNLAGCSASAGSAYLWNVPGHGSSTLTYKICMTNIYINLPKCPVTSTGRCTTDNTVPYARISDIVLPNNTAFSFQYDTANPNNTSTLGAGDLTQITYPTGGSSSFVWNDFAPVCSSVQNLYQGRRMVSRTHNPINGSSSTWTYTSSFPLTPVSTETDPLGNETDHIFTNVQSGACAYYETQTQNYQGSSASGTLLRTNTTQYHSDPGGGGAMNVLPTTQTVAWASGQTATTQLNYAFDVNIGSNIPPVSYGNVTSKSESDYGNGLAGPLLRITNTTFQYQNSSAYQTNNLVSLPATVSVTDGSGNLLAATTYGYDETSLASSGVTAQHDSAPPAGSARGNLTSSTRSISVSSGSSAVSRNTYFDTGKVSSSADPNGNKTLFAYSSTFFGAYLTGVTNALGQSSSYNFDFNTGELLSVTDPNNQVTTYTYDVMLRPTSVNYPDGGQQSITYQEMSLPFTDTVTKKISGSQNLVTNNVFDGLGRVSQAQLASDQDGTDLTDNTYDGLGRVFTQSNPHRSTTLSTDGVTTTFYDALGRTCLVVPADATPPTGNTCPTTQPANTILTTYVGSTVTSTDQAGNNRRSVADGLGHLTEVDEPGGESPGSVASGSLTIAGSLNSVTSGGAAATAGSGSISLSGSEKSTVTSPGTVATGSVTISGAEQSAQVNDDPRCAQKPCPRTVFDSGTVSVTINGFTASASYGKGSTDSSVATALASALGASGSPVTASASGAVVTLTSIATGTAADYSLSATSATTEIDSFGVSSFSSASFTPSVSGSALTGGKTAVTVFDAGTVTVTINGTAASAPYSSSSTTSTIASALASALNSGSLVSATASGSSVSFNSKATGSATNYSLSVSSASSNSSLFSPPSFSISDSGSVLTGGANAVNGTTTFDSGTLSVAVGSFTASAISYGPTNNSTASQVATAVANALRGSGSPVTAASVSGATISLTYNGVGTAGDVSITVTPTSSNSSQFSSGSFASSGSLSGGANPVAASLTTPQITLYTYNALGNLLNVTQKGGSSNSASWRIRTFTYDSLSRLLSAVHPESGKITYSYDANGNVLNKTDARGITTTYAYDALNRLTSKKYSNGDAAVTYTYDQGTNGRGHRTAMTDAAGSESWTYDPLGRPTNDQRTTNGVSKTTSYTYNLDGSVATLTYPSGRIINYAPNAAGRTISAVDVANSINYATAAKYAPTGALSSLTNGVSILSTFYYNDRLQPCRIAVQSSGTVPTSCTDAANIGNILDYAYNFSLGAGDNGNVTAIINHRDNTRSQNFTYDALNRLSSAQTQTSGVTIPNANCWGLIFGYDAWGNLLSSTSSGPSGCGEPMPLSVTATTANQISGYCYDPAGNMLDQTACPTSGSHAYAYNAENQLTSAAGVTYSYDGDGKRVQKFNGKLYWYGANSAAIEETNSSGNLTNEYIFFNGQRIARRDSSNNVVYYFNDHLGTSRVITNAAGVILDDSDFYPFGAERPVSSSSGNTYKFTGIERDLESGMDNFGVRYYASAMGRFTSTDPVQMTPRRLLNPQQFNLYLYAGDNPLRFSDWRGFDLVKVIVGDLSVTVDRSIAQNAQGFLEDAKTAGIPLTINFSFRTTAEQVRLKADESGNPNPVAKPGTSPHEAGQAIDVSQRRLSPEQRLELIEIGNDNGLPTSQKDPVHFGTLKADKDLIIENQTNPNPTTIFDNSFGGSIEVNDSAFQIETEDSPLPDALVEPGQDSSSGDAPPATGPVPSTDD